HWHMPKRLVVTPQPPHAGEHLRLLEVVEWRAVRGWDTKLCFIARAMHCECDARTVQENAGAAVHASHVRDIVRLSALFQVVRYHSRRSGAAGEVLKLGEKAACCVGAIFVADEVLPRRINNEKRDGPIFQVFKDRVDIAAAL